MTRKTEKPETEDDSSVMSWVDFLQDHPPGGPVTVSGIVVRYKGQDNRVFDGISHPQLHIHCPGPKCNNKMFFLCFGDPDELPQGRAKEIFLRYTCRNCGEYFKIFSVSVRRGEEGKGTEVYKFGEYPPFGPPLPSRVLRLVQDDRDFFMKGRQCENQGLGIGAFSYYRRVLENQWGRIVDEIIRVARAINVSQEIIDSLLAVRDQQQFSKAVKEIKSAIPPGLLINGEDPLLLLHNALSQGVHTLPDEDCLSLATSIRVVLVEFAEKLGEALKDEKELKDAIARLSQIRAKKKKKQGDETEADE
jgi:hypothetical protein